MTRLVRSSLGLAYKTVACERTRTSWRLSSAAAALRLPRRSCRSSRSAGPPWSTMSSCNRWQLLQLGSCASAPADACRAHPWTTSRPWPGGHRPSSAGPWPSCRSGVALGERGLEILLRPVPWAVSRMQRWRSTRPTRSSCLTGAAETGTAGARTTPPSINAASVARRRRANGEARGWCFTGRDLSCRGSGRQWGLRRATRGVIHPFGRCPKRSVGPRPPRAPPARLPEADTPPASDLDRLAEEQCLQRPWPSSPARGYGASTAR